MKPGRIRRSDWVEVRSPEEVLTTLDADGALDGLPFMPEMLDWCGRRFRVERRVEQTCIDFIGKGSANRPFRRRDVVTLEGARCDGSAHDGCARACKIFWKEAWLRPAGTGGSISEQPPASSGAPGATLRTKSGAERYYCQSTQLRNATESPAGGTKSWRLRALVTEIGNGDISVFGAVCFVARWLWWRLLWVVHGDDWLRGERTSTPDEALDLKPGERVRVKSIDQIVATLDRRRMNRGLMISAEMTRYCGREAVVRGRVPRIISERTGRMLEMQNTVTLWHGAEPGRPTRDTECLCHRELGDCPRGELMYWREAWLDREGSTDA